MKRLLGMILSVLLLISAVPALAEDTAEIAVDVQVFTVNVSVTTTLAERLTLKVYRMANGERDVLIHVWQENSFEVTKSGNKYIFDSFRLDETDETGIYQAVINDTYTEDFRFVNSADKETLYKEIAETTPENMEAFLQGAVEQGLVDFDLKGYFTYPDAVQENINKGIASISFPALSENPTTEELEAFAAVLEPEVERLLTVAELATAGASTFGGIVDAVAESFGLDMTYYDDETLKMEPAWVQARFSALAIPDYSEEAVQNAFDTAVLLAMIDRVGYTAVTEAMAHYDGGCIMLDKTKVSGFTQAQMNSVSIFIQENAASISSAAGIEAAYVAGAEAVAKAAMGVVGGGAGGGAGGGGGGFGGISGGSGNKPSAGKEETGKEETLPTVTFSDLSQADWAKESITYLATHGVISGKGDGKYYPNDTVTREEFVKIIVEAFEIDKTGAQASFEDVAEERWSYPYIAAAYTLGIVTGTDEITFYPTGKITRQDMAVIMYRVAELSGLSLTETTLTFGDSAAIAPYAEAAVSALFHAGIINGVGDNLFAPTEVVTRAQAAKIVFELLKSTGGVR